MKSLYEVKNLKKIENSTIFELVNFSINKGDSIGFYTSDKDSLNTLFSCLTTIYDVNEGEIIFEGKVLNKLPSEERAKFRSLELGISNIHLIEEAFMVEGFFKIVMQNLKETYKEKLSRIKKSIEFVGLYEDILKCNISKLNVYEKTLLGLAFGIVNSPKLLFHMIDSSSLDKKELSKIQDLLQKINKEKGIATLIFTDEWNLKISKVYKLKNSRLTR